MSLRKPIVLNGGQLQQLQAGDTLDATSGGSLQMQLTNANAGSLVPGTPVYASANDSVNKAKADASGTMRCIGLAAGTIVTATPGPIAVLGPLTLTTAQWDAAFGTTGGLTVGVTYYVSATTVGTGTATAPSTVGQYVQEIGVAISTTELLVNPRPPVLL